MITMKSSLIRRVFELGSAVALLALSAACGGGGGSDAAPTADVMHAPPSGAVSALSVTARPAMTQLDAVRLAHQASFGPSETLVAEIKAQGAEAWLAAQLARSDSRYTSGGTPAVHQFPERTTFCALPAFAPIPGIELIS